ncbi:MAG: iron transporter permease [Gammaproteobacteria bacterium]|jgi:iron complex transport system permease protein|nr:iron transporter permease [Gammaproteobacteria bacterium]
MKNNKTSVRYIILSTLLLAVFLLSLHLGAVSISYTQLVPMLFHPFASQHSEIFSVIWFLRLPRLLAILLVGMGLGLAGAVMQGLLRNPLADPGLLGVSSGSSLAILVFWLIGGHFVDAALWQYMLPFAALLGSLAVLSFLYICAKWSMQRDIAGLVLIGIACNALFSSLIAFLLYLGPPQFLENAVLWGFGGVSSISWGLLGSSSILFAIGAFILLKQASALNVLALGEEDAMQVGLDVNRFKTQCIVGVALLIAASVALAGAIAFVGLIVPHIMRKIMGANHRHLLTCSALAGGIFLLSADMLCQNISHAEVLPLGIVTALLGALFFMWLLVYYRRAAC